MNALANRVFDRDLLFSPLADKGMFSPRCDVYDTTDAILVHCELPGVSKDKVIKAK